MHENMKIWDNLKQVPTECIRTITGGRLKGLSDIKPQWRLQAMTHQFGPCGIGWKYEITNKETWPGSDGQIIATVDINLFIKINNDWSSPIPGTGGAMLVAKETKGTYTNDEAFKMALTDALSVSMKSIGVASDIYMGAFNGSKFADTSNITKPPIEAITQHQVEHLSQLAKEADVDLVKFMSFFNINGLNELPSTRFDEAIKMIKIKLGKLNDNS